MSRRPEDLGGTTRDDDLRVERAGGNDDLRHRDGDQGLSQHDRGVNERDRDFNGRDGGHAGAVSPGTERHIDVRDGSHDEHLEHGRRLTHGYGNGTAIAAFVLGMFALSYTLTGILAPVALIVGLVAFGMGIKGMSNAKRMDGHHRGLAISGLVLGLLATLLAIGVMGAAAFGIDQLMENININEVQQRFNDVQEEAGDIAS